MRFDVEDIDPKKMATQLRLMADEVEKNDFVAFAIVSCDQEGNAHNFCLVDVDLATHDLLDEMAYSCKAMLIDSYEARSQ